MTKQSAQGFNDAVEPYARCRKHEAAAVTHHGDLIFSERTEIALAVLCQRIFGTALI